MIQTLFAIGIQKNDMSGKWVYQGTCIGYGIPYGASITSPEQYAYNGATLPLAEPNGLYTNGVTSSATWVLTTDKDGNVISDKQKIVADRTSTSNIDRQYRCTFNLKQQKYSNTAIYYLVIQDEAGLQVPIKEEFQIDISMSFDNFDFFG